MTGGELLLYVALPYAAMSTFIVGHLWRYRRDQYGWGARSSQLLESKVLRYASITFHVGALAAIGGHVLGLLVPRSWTAAVGVDDAAYHAVALIGGLTAGAAVCVGFAMLVYRRMRFPRVRATTTRLDVITFALLGAGIVSGMLATLTNLGDAVHYRESVGPYFRHLLILNPQPELMTSGDVTFIFQLHVSLVWLLVAFWPFSRLVHVWSVPVDYPRRSPILYRSRGRRGAPANEAVLTRSAHR